MRKFALSLAALTALSSSITPALASEGRGQPFITAAYYKKNITLDQFNTNGRSFFDSERKFDLIVEHVADEIGRPLSDAEFLALMKDKSQTRARNCPTSEVINTGSYDNGEFHWFERNCRSGEQIVQVLVNGVWKDMFSLNCLNGAEDKTIVPPPSLTYAPPVPTTPVVPRRGRGATMTTTAGANQQAAAPYVGGVILFDGGGHKTVVKNGSASASGSRSSSTTTGGGCNTCAPRTH